MSFLLYSSFLEKIFQKYILFFSYYLITQNLIAIAILPIYSSWGIPFHFLSILGNLVFTPFLACYLFLSFLIFIGICFRYTSFSLIFILKKITTIWLSMMNFLATLLPNVAIGFVDHPTISYPLCWGSIFIFFFFFNIQSNTAKKCALITTLLFISVLFILKSQKKNKLWKIIEYKQKKYLLRYNDKESLFIIPLQNKKVQTNLDFYQYAIKPEALRTFGIIDPLVYVISSFPRHKKTSDFLMKN